MALDTSPSIRRDLAVGTIAGLGIATFLTVYLHIERLETGDDAMVLVSLFGLLLSGPLIVGGLQLLRQRYTAADALRITGWVLLGSVPLLVLTLVLVSFSGALAIVLGDPFILLSGMVALGGLAGMAFGLYELELKRAKAAVQETANRLDAIISGSPIPIVGLDVDGRVTMWNAAAEETFKYEADEVLGEPYPLAPADRAEEAEDHFEQVREGDDLLGVETVRERKDGVRIDVEIWTARLSDSGSFDGIVALIADVSDRKRREQEVQVLHRVLRHNLRNDLNVIQGNAARVAETLEPLETLRDRIAATRWPGEGGDTAETAGEPADMDTRDPEEPAAKPGAGSAAPQGTADEGDDPVTGSDSPAAPTMAELETVFDASVSESREYTDLMRRKAEELVELTEKAQRAETILRSTVDEHRSVEVATLMNHPIRDLELEYPDARFETSIEEDLEVLVNGPLGVAVRELAENSILHVDEPAPLIELTATTSGERARIEVRDHGPGIPAEERRVIAEGEESSMLHSSGLGLWLANWLVNRSGGTLTFETDETGSVARIELPRGDDSATADHDEATEPDAGTE